MDQIARRAHRNKTEYTIANRNQVKIKRPSTPPRSAYTFLSRRKFAPAFIDAAREVDAGEGILLGMHGRGRPPCHPIAGWKARL